MCSKVKWRVGGLLHPQWNGTLLTMDDRIQSDDERTLDKTLASRGESVKEER